VRRHAVNALSAFCFAFDISQDLENLYRLIKDEDHIVRREAAVLFGAAFLLIREREFALEDLHRLTYDRDRNVRRKVIVALCANLPFVSDQRQHKYGKT